MSEASPEVPAEIESYLIELYARAGQIGGSIGAAAAGAAGSPGAALAGSRGGARGGARGAARLKTKVEVRDGEAAGTGAEAAARLIAAFPKARRLPADDRVRLAVPVGLTGLQQVVLDLELGPEQDGAAIPHVHAQLSGYGKEGLLSRKPTRTITDQAWAAVTSGG
jgi:hypothetical protein